MIKALSKIYYIDDHLRERERERKNACLPENSYYRGHRDHKLEITQPTKSNVHDFQQIPKKWRSLCFTYRSRNDPDFPPDRYHHYRTS